jgi:hypothetical protein
MGYVKVETENANYMVSFDHHERKAKIPEEKNVTAPFSSKLNNHIQQKRFCF